MQQAELAYIFPAFSTEHPFDDIPGHKGLSDHFSTLLESAVRHTNLPLAKDFHLSGEAIIREELACQLATFIYSCALDDLFRQYERTPAFSAGYSMGLYAALYHSGSLGFTDGIDVILAAFHEIKKTAGDIAYGMASVVGLEEKDIVPMIKEQHLSLEITNRNNPIAFIVSGKLEEIEEFTSLAKEEGALHLHMMNVSVPYHSRFLAKVEKNFRDFVNSKKIVKPETRIVSLVDQTILKDPDDVRDELVRNLYSHLDWCRTQEFLEENKVTAFVEMGPGNGLVKNARFVRGNFRFLTAREYISSL